MTELQIDVVAPDHPDARAAVTAYLRELDERFATGFDPEQAAHDEVEFTGDRGLFLVARVDGPGEGGVAGCGALRWLPDAPDGQGVAEIKRMWVDPARRGQGLAGRLLARLESEALGHARPLVRLDTHADLEAAIALYRRSGYREVPRYNDNPYAQHWFEKRLS